MDTFLSAYSTDQKEIVNMLSSTLFRALFTNQSMDQLMDTFLSAYSTDQKEIVNMLSSTLSRAFQGEFTLVRGLLPAV